MKSALILSVAFFSGAHGFAIFAPYLAFLLALAHFLRIHRRRKAALVHAVAATAVPASLA